MFRPTTVEMSVKEAGPSFARGVAEPIISRLVEVAETIIVINAIYSKYYCSNINHMCWLPVMPLDAASRARDPSLLPWPHFCDPKALSPRSNQRFTITMTFNERIAEDMKTAMRAKDSLTLSVLRGLKSALMYAGIEKAGPSGELDDVECVVVVRKEIKKRQDSVTSYQTAKRDDLANAELAELAVLETYLPAGLSATEIAAMVDAVIAETGATTKKDMGRVMKLLGERAAGRVDGGTLSKEVAKRLV